MQLQILYAGLLVLLAAVLDRAGAIQDSTVESQSPYEENLPAESVFLELEKHMKPIVDLLNSSLGPDNEDALEQECFEVFSDLVDSVFSHKVPSVSGLRLAILHFSLYYTSKAVEKNRHVLSRDMLDQLSDGIYADLNSPATESSICESIAKICCASTKLILLSGDTFVSRLTKKPEVLTLEEEDFKNLIWTLHLHSLLVEFLPTQKEKLVVPTKKILASAKEFLVSYYDVRKLLETA
ncbi:uncharacterized protein NEMAJ01_0469 [Nematocida major]|uniref:uncharacterized protein n=1 Tax=Nematocida major TaxID=1912982 RepID=UPI0020083272|nr:uncharacterized protein NEMAJ01_0469 [Nematocida major]KAH9385573.1 hypothetical protein NEMAJ01_0469 [Nematocida major]